MSETFKSSITQFIAVFIISSVVYFLYWLVKRKNNPAPLWDYLGLRFDKAQFDKPYFMILFAVVLYGFIGTYIQFHFLDDMKNMMLSDTSPYGRILRDSSGIEAFLSGLIYCFIQASASEELLFRGLFAKRLFNTFGSRLGNVIQATLFWIMHLLIFKLAFGLWFSKIQFIAFITSFGLGLLLGYVVYRKGGRSIYPAFLLHGMANFASFIMLSIVSN